MLDGPELVYYKFNNTHKNKPRGVFNLMGRCLVKVYFDECEEAPENKPFCFNITSTVRGESLICSGKTEDEMRAWVAVIKMAIGEGDVRHAKKLRMVEDTAAEKEERERSEKKHMKRLCKDSAKCSAQLNRLIEEAKSIDEVVGSESAGVCILSLSLTQTIAAS